MKNKLLDDYNKIIETTKNLSNNRYIQKFKAKGQNITYVSTEKLTKKTIDDFINSLEENKKIKIPNLFEQLNSATEYLLNNPKIIETEKENNTEDEYNFYEEENDFNDDASKWLKQYKQKEQLQKKSQEIIEQKETPKRKSVVIRKYGVNPYILAKFKNTDNDISYFNKLINIIDDKFNVYNENPNYYKENIGVVNKLFCFLELHTYFENIKNTQDKYLIKETQRILENKLKNENFILDNIDEINFNRTLQLKDIILENQNFFENKKIQNLLIKITDKKPELLSYLNFEYFYDENFTQNILKNKNCVNKFNLFPYFIKENPKYIKMALTTSVSIFDDLPEKFQNDKDIINFKEKIEKQNQKRSNKLMEEIKNSLKYEI